MKCLLFVHEYYPYFMSGDWRITPHPKIVQSAKVNEERWRTCSKYNDGESDWGKKQFEFRVGQVEGQVRRKMGMKLCHYPGLCYNQNLLLTSPAEAAVFWSWARSQNRANFTITLLLTLHGTWFIKSVPTWVHFNLSLCLTGQTTLSHCQSSFHLILPKCTCLRISPQIIHFLISITGKLFHISFTIARVHL